MSDLVKVTKGNQKKGRTSSSEGFLSPEREVQKGYGGILSKVRQMTYWFPNSEDTNKKPVFRTHMAVATGIVSKYFSLISVT